ncbi:MAG TPA: methyltransferase domain-containing protein [Thermodesulfobacteriota bacterium]|nr:methyltransferase domain-containing protein [Thermodesulfobacteriota bacterium]
MEKKDFFDRHAVSWDQDFGGKDRTHQAKEVVRWFRLTQNDSVLDVGTGTGILLPFIREAIGVKGRLTAIDFSYKMLEKAKTRDSAGEAFLVNASVEWIPFRNDQFHRVTCFSAFPHFPNKSRALFEMVRILKSNGRLFIAHLSSAEEINLFHQQVGGPVAHDLLPHPERFRDLMNKAGLCDISIINQPGKFLAQGKKV